MVRVGRGKIVPVADAALPEARFARRADLLDKLEGVGQHGFFR